MLHTPKIQIHETIENQGWSFEVSVIDDTTESTHIVKLTKEYYEDLTDNKLPPKELIKISFEFLLDHEPKESILGQFELDVISNYFPEYTEFIKKNTNL